MRLLLDTCTAPKVEQWHIPLTSNVQAMPPSPKILMIPFGIPATWHCFGVLGETVGMGGQLAHPTACPKADKQWHIFETEKRFEPGHPF